VTKISREDGFTLSEMLVSTTIMLIVTGTALTTFKQGLMVNDSASQLADANQNLRAGTNQLVKDIMMAGRIIGPGGVPLPTGTGALTFNRPGPPGSTLTFNASLVTDTDTSLNLSDIVTGYQLGPTINGSSTDMITILMIDEFMPILTGNPNPSVSPNVEGTLNPDGSSITVPTASLWLTGDTTNDTPPIQQGDLVFFKNGNGSAIQTVTRTDATHIYFDANNSNDWFRFNQRNTAFVGTVLTLKCNNGCAPDTTTAFPMTTLFRALMVTYYVDNTTTSGTPRLTRVVNHYTPQALAGVVEDLDLTYDLVDGVNNPTSVTSLPYTDVVAGVTYNANEIRKVNIHVGVRSEVLSKPSQDYVRNHISTAVDVRSLASVSRYLTTLTQ
jgi:pilin/secretion family protein with methylation motif